MLIEIYGDAVQCIKSSDFDANDKEPIGQRRNFDHNKLQALLGINPAQIRKKLTEHRGVDESTVGKPFRHGL